MKLKETLRGIIREEVRKVVNESTVSSVMTKHQQALLKALTARKRNQEDEDAHDAIKAELQAIAKELRLDPTIPFMEDEMFSGSESPKDAYKYAMEMFTDMVEENKMKLSELQQIIREEIGKALNEAPGMWVIYAEQNGKKKEINRVPANKLNTALHNIGARYMDDMDVIIAAMTETDWDKLGQ